jgi:hypothetical protein
VDNTEQFCTEAYTNPAHVQIESGFLIYVFNAIDFGPEADTNPTHWHMIFCFVM